MKIYLSLILIAFCVTSFSQAPKIVIEKLNLSEQEVKEINEKRLMILKNREGKEYRIYEQVSAKLYSRSDSTEHDIFIEAFLEEYMLIAILEPRAVISGEVLLDLKEHRSGDSGYK